MNTIGGLRRVMRKAGFAVLRHTPRLRLTVRHAYWRMQRHRYERLRAGITVDPRLVFLESFGGRSISCSPKALYQAMLADGRYDDYHFVWSVKADVLDEATTLLGPGSRTRIVQRGSEEYFTSLARAGVIIINTRLPEYVWPGDGQTFVQCWHGTPLKRLGYDVEIETTNALNTTTELASRFGLDARKWTYLISPSAYTSRHLCDAFGLPKSRRADVVIEAGYPRNDALANTDADVVHTIRERLGIPDSRKALLYAPTWRDDSYRPGVGYTFDYLLDFDAMRDALGDGWVVLFRPHYYIANRFDFSKYEGFVIDASKTGDINDLYLAADVLLTDYSSVMFDYANTRRPMLLFTPDRARYAGRIRGFYMDFGSIPAPNCETTDEVITELRGLDTYETRYGEQYRRFVNTYCPHDDGRASGRVLRRIFG
ncbi:CDP-glycerol glycerophosphotransferase family protein [Bifidobacterium sp. 82T24]|uniref:CDP-glycerol glycerophosphotransferase family protein n=1 Tax=Bifidobacterium pluvialisilvae TaxID=2834436 RepID=UPI001C594362|nr:CDP-glycerol glycerophosphotransferase family protein [Bifidobacterium pluvialisilvae]MBW3088449.1 CDP-glycerol glycerophosphotransferase family protein [Bifidobacterium pluvialisilvae]